MKFSSMLVLGALALAGCAGGGLTPMNTATMPLNQYGAPLMSQGAAINLSSWALNDPAVTAGKPELAARAIAAEDWLAGQTILYGNYGAYSPGGEYAWQVFRRQVRAAIGVPQDAPSQELVDRLLATASALKAGNVAAARAQLSAPIFTLGPDRTLAALGDLPPFGGRDWAFAQLEQNTNRSIGTSPMGGLFH